MSAIADASLAPAGERKIAWAAEWMPVLARVRDRLDGEGALRGRRVGLVLALDPKVGSLAALLADVGAEVTVASPGAGAQDDVAAALAARGVGVFARRDATPEEEVEFYGELLRRRAEVVIDERAVLVRLAHGGHRDALASLVGATVSARGGAPLEAMAAEGTLEVPCISLGGSRCAALFADRYGSGQSVIEAVLDNTNLLLAGRKVVVVGFGWLGKGVARRARGMAARVVVAETDPFAALEAHYGGYEVLPLDEACEMAQVVVATRGFLPAALLERLPDGTIVASPDAGGAELDLAALRARALATQSARPNVEEVVLAGGRSVFVIGGGVEADRAAGEGIPSELADVTLSLHALCARHLLVRQAELPPGVHEVPASIDEAVARDAAAALGLPLEPPTAG